MKNDIPEECSIDIQKFSSDKLYSFDLYQMVKRLEYANNNYWMNISMQDFRLSVFQKFEKWGLRMLFTFLVFSSFIRWI